MKKLPQTRPGKRSIATSCFCCMRRFSAPSFLSLQVTEIMDSHAALHWAHILVLGPLLLAIGFGYAVDYPMIVAGLGAFIVLYHVYRGWTKWASGQGGVWVNAIHALVVGPALIAEGWTGARWIREIIIMLGFAGIGYHAYYLTA